MNLARAFAYTRFLEDELEIAHATIEKLLEKIPGIVKHQVSVPTKPIEFKPLLKRPSARDYIRKEEHRIWADANEPKSNVKVEAT